MHNVLKISAALAGAVLIAATAVVSKALLLPSLPSAVAETPVRIANIDAAARRLGGAIQIETVSHSDGQDRSASFIALHRYLETNFPLLHTKLKREIVGGYSLLYTWEGSDPALPPILIAAHTDVVPVERGTEENWQYPPFSGSVADGYVWGRGTLDMKYAVMASMESVELLLAEGFRPRRTVLLAFGHDEELGGKQGAGAIVDLLRKRNVRPMFSVDEGGFVLQGFFPGTDRPVAQIGLAEKGYVSLALTAKTKGGHSSVPPSVTAIGEVSRAIAALSAQPMTASLDGPGGRGLIELAPALPFSLRMAFANTWLLEPLLVAQLEKLPATNAMIRTTIAPTILSAGVKDNVLPAQAQAVVNFRIAPGDSVAKVKAHVAQAINNPEVKISEYGIPAVEPSPVADRRAAGFKSIVEALMTVMPDAIPTQGVVVAGTDSRHYGTISENAYRFLPVQLKPVDVARYHGTNERISVESYRKIIGFYVALMRTSASGNKTVTD